MQTLIILSVVYLERAYLGWYNETNIDRNQTYQAKKVSFIKHNLNIDLITIISHFDDPVPASLNNDISIFKWYKQNRVNIESERYLIVGWDNAYAVHYFWGSWLL